MLEDIIPGTNATQPYIRFGDSSGIDSGASDYAWYYAYLRQRDSGWLFAKADNVAFIKINPEAIGDGTGDSYNAVAYLHPNHASTAGWSAIQGTQGYPGDAGGETNMGQWVGVRKAKITVDRIQLYMSSGTVASGRMSVWGIAHA